MIRILYTIPSLTTAGSGQALLEVARRLDRSRFEPSVAIGRNEPSHLRLAYEKAGIPVLPHPATVPSRPLRRLRTLARNAGGRFPHGHWQLWHSFHYLDDYTEPFVARAAGAGAWVYTKKNMSWSWRSWLVRSLLADGILAQNPAMLERFFRPWPLRTKAFLAPCGVDTERFQPRSRPGPHEGSLRIACVANLIPLKRQDLLVRALALQPRTELLLVGSTADTSFLEALKSLASELGVAERVHFVGRVEDVRKLLDTVDLFALVSDREGSPVALLEAMACGLACIGSDIPGIRQIIEDQHSGLLVGPSPEAISRAITALRAPDVRETLGAAARQRIEEHFSIEREVRNYQDFYEWVAKRKNLGTSGRH